MELLNIALQEGLLKVAKTQSKNSLQDLGNFLVNYKKQWYFIFKKHSFLWDVCIPQLIIVKMIKPIPAHAFLMEQDPLVLGKHYYTIEGNIGCGKSTFL